MAIECYFDECKFHTSHQCEDAEECEGPICNLTECAQTSINKFLFTEFLGKPECDRIGGCLKETCGLKSSCKCDNDGFVPNLFTPGAFMLLWKEARKREWFKEFYSQKLTNSSYSDYHDEFTTWFDLDSISEFNFPILLAEYLGWKADI